MHQNCTIILLGLDQAVKSKLVHLLFTSTSSRIICLNSISTDSIFIPKNQTVIFLVGLLQSGTFPVAELRKKYLNSHFIGINRFESFQEIHSAIRNGSDGCVSIDTVEKDILKAIATVMQGGKFFSSDIIHLIFSHYHNEPERQRSRSTITPQEHQVIKLFSAGKIYKEVASHLFISENTVRSHVRSIYEKMNVHSKSELISKAIQEQLI